jgi:hypothetical protein
VALLGAVLASVAAWNPAMLMAGPVLAAATPMTEASAAADAPAPTARRARLPITPLMA